MNIVLVNSEYRSPSGVDHGGIATYTYASANALATAGHRVTILNRAGVTADRVHERVCLVTFDHRQPPRLLRHFDKLRGSRVSWEYGCSRAVRDAVLAIHARTPVDAVEVPEYNGLGSAFGPSTPFPIVVHLHTPSYLVDRFNRVASTPDLQRWYSYEAKAVRKAAHVVSPSAWLRTEICHELKMPTEQVSVIRHCLDTALFDRIAPGPKAGEPIDILFAGRLERRKGAEILVGTVQQMLALDPRIRLTFAGETALGESTDYRAAIERSLSENERSRTWFLGPVSRERLPALYKQSDIFLFPSLFENAPFALLEAMAAGLPVVAGDVPGVNEIVQHNKTGMLFDLNQPASLVQCVRELVLQPQQRATLARGARQHLDAEYSPHRFVEQTIALYERLKIRKH